MAKQDKKTARDVGKKLFDDITDSSVDARNVVDEFYKNLQKGGKAAQPILNELSKLFSKAGDATQKASKAVENFNDSISKGKKEFDSLQKTLATYDGPRFKAAGMITEELSKQLSYNEMLAKSKNSLNALDATTIAYSKLLSNSSQELVDIDNARYESIKQLNDAKSNSNSLTGELIGLLKDESDLANQIAENNVKSFDLAQKLQKETDPEKINQLEKEGLQLKIESLDLEGKLLENKKNQKSINDSLQTSLETETNLKNDLQVLADNRLQTEKDIAFQTAINNDATGRLRATFENINKITGEQIGSQGELAKKMQEVEDSAYKVGTAQFRQVDLTDDINDKIKEQRELEFTRASILDETNGLLPEQRKEALALIDANVKINQEQLKQAQALQASAEAYETVNDKANALRDSMMAPVDKLFGLVPDNISNMLGLGKIQDELKEKVGASISNAFMSASGPMTGFFSAATAGAGTLMATLAPILPLLLAIAGVVALVKMFSDADKEVAQLSKDLGVSYQEAIKVKESAVDLAAEMGSVVVTAEQVTQAMVDLKKATGMNLALVVDTNKAAKNFVETSALLATHFGMTADESVELNQSAAILGTTIDKIGVGADMMGDELMSSTEIMKTIGKTSKSILFNFKGNVGALMAAVKQAKMMGTTLEKVAAAGDKLLDIESSLVAESKVRVMLGRNISLDAARYYALTGQTEKLMEELKKQAGSVAEYDKMAPMQKKMLADALGMSNDELAEMMAKEKELQLLGYDANKLEDIRAKAKAGILNVEEELSKLTDDEAKKKLIEITNEERRAGIQEKLMKMLTKVQDLLYKIIEPLIPVVDDFVESLGDGQGVLNGLSKTFGVIGDIIGIIAKVTMPIISGILSTMSFTLNLILWPFEKIYDLAVYIKEELFGIKDVVDETGKPLEETSKTMELIQTIAKGIGILIGGWFVLKGLGMVKGAFTSMYDSSKSVLNTTKNIGTSLMDSAKGFREGMKGAADEGGGFLSKMKAGFKGLFKKKSPVDEVTDKAKTDVDKVKTPDVDTKGPEKVSKSGLEKFKDNMRNLADGLKAMGEPGVGKGILNLALAGPAFIIALPAIPMILFMGKASLDKLATNFTNLATGLTEMGNAGRQGILNIALAGPALLLGLVGLPFIFAFNKMDTGKLSSNFTNLATGINSMSTASPAGLLAIAGSGPALLLGLIGLPFIFAFNKMDTSKLISNFTNLAGGLNAMAGGLVGVAALAAFAVAAILAIPSLVFLGGIALLGAAGAAGLTALGGGLEVLGGVAATGLPFLAVALIAALGVAMIPFAAALLIATPALKVFADMVVGVFGKLPPIIESIATGIATIIDAVGTNISKIMGAVADSIVKISDVDPIKLGAVGLALGALGAGLIALTAGEVVNGIASFFGASPVDTLKELESVNGAKLKETGAGIDSMAKSLKTFGSVNVDPIDNVAEALDNFNTQVIKGGIGDALNNFLGSDPFAIFDRIAKIDTAKLDIAAASIEKLANSMKAFNDVNSDAINNTADALGNFNNQVIKAGVFEGLSSLLGVDPLAVFKQLQELDDAKITSVSNAITLSGNSIEAFNEKISSLDDSIVDKGDLITTLLNDITEIEYDEIDALATAIDNLAKSYDTLMESMKKITDADIARMQQIAAATPKEVSGGGLLDVIGDTISSAVSGVKDLAGSAIKSVGSFFGFGEEEPATETPVAVTAPVTPVMQPTATVTPAVTATAPVTNTVTQTDNKKLEDLLRELIAKVDQPVIMKIGEKAVSEISNQISIRKSYSANMNTGRA